VEFDLAYDHLKARWKETGQKDNLLPVATAGNPDIILGGNKGLRRKGIGLLFTEVTIALVVDEGPLFLVFEHLASFMGKNQD
jgi:hypothetical protein